MTVINDHSREVFRQLSLQVNIAGVSPSIHRKGISSNHELVDRTRLRQEPEVALLINQIETDVKLL